MSALEPTLGRRLPAWPRILPAVRPRAALSSRAWRLAFPAAVGLAVFVWSRLTWAPESDPALHLALIRGIAQDGRLPTELPYFPARIGEGGVIESMFPYSYTPLYHIIGAGLYSIWGNTGVLLINAFAAAAITAVLYAFIARRLPWYVAGCSALLAFLPTLALSLFVRTFMEPTMLAFYFAGAWCLYLASATRSPRAGILAGLLLGLAVGTRQVALLYVGVLALLGAMHLADRQCWRIHRLRLELPWMLAALGALALTAAPFLAYLVHASGVVGYADVVLPGTRPALAVDPVATEYISSITKPGASPVEWLDKYRRTLLFNERWIPLPYQLIPFGLFAVGALYMARCGGISRFFARLAVVQLVVEVVLFVTVHASSRYVIASQMLFHSLIPVGAYVSVRWCASRAGAVGSARRRAVAAGSALAAAALIAPALFSMGYAHYVDNSYALRDFRARSHTEVAEWLERNTADDALVLTPRTYTAELTFTRNIAWVTFFGNAWVIDAISAPDPAVAHDILARYGVDYVLVPAPPGVYLDRMPAGGMRSYLQFGREAEPYFTLEYVTQTQGTINGQRVNAGLRVYRVNALEASR